MKRLLALYAAIALALGASAAGIRLPDQGGGGVPEVLGGGSLHVTIQGEGDPLGTELGNITVDSTDPATSAVSGWTANADGYSDAGNGDKLLGPLQPKNTQTGYWVLVQRGGSTEIRRALFIPYGDYGTYRVSLTEDNSYAEAVDFKYDGDDSGQNPFFEVTPVAGKLAADGTRIYVHRADAAPDTSITRADLDAIKSTQNADQRRLTALENDQRGGVSSQAVTDAINAALSAYTPPAQNPDATDWTNDAANHTLTLTGRDANGNPRHEVITYGGTGSSGLTSTAAVHAAMAFLATQVAEFSWDASTHTLTFTPDANARQNNITFDELAQALQSKIDAKLDGPGVDRRVFGTSGRLDESKLPQRVDDFADAITNVGGWADSTSGSIRRQSYTSASPANIGVDYPSAYVASYLAHPRESGPNLYKAVSLPTGADPDEWRFAVGSYAYYTGDVWTLVESNDAGRDFYVVSITDIPAGDTVHLERFANFTINGPRIGIDAWATVGNTDPIPHAKLTNAPTGSPSLSDRNFVRGQINNLVSAWAEQGDTTPIPLGKLSLAPGEANDPLVTTGQVDAGTSNDEVTYTPALVQRQINNRVPAPQSPANDDDVLVFDGTNVAWQAPNASVADGRYGAADRTTNLTSILPAAAAANRNTFLDVNGRIFFNFDGTSWTELAKRADVLGSEEQNYPAHVVTPQSEISNVRFQVENYKAATRDDQSLVFAAVVPHDVPVPGQPTQHFGSAAGTAVPSGVIHATWYPANYQDAAFRNKILFTARQALVNFAPTSLRIRESTQAVGQEQSLAVTRYTRGNAFLGYLTAALPSAAGKSFLVNWRNASANFAYLTDSASEVQYVAISELQPRLLSAASSAFITRLRVNDANDWEPGDSAVNWGVTKANLPDGWQFQIRMKVGTRSRLMFSDWRSVDEFEAFPDADWDRQLTSSATRIAAQILGKYSVPAEDSSPNASSFQLNVRGTTFCWIGWIDDRLAFRSDHPEFFVANGSALEVWVKPF